VNSVKFRGHIRGIGSDLEQGEFIVMHVCFLHVVPAIDLRQLRRLDSVMHVDFRLLYVSARAEPGHMYMRKENVSSSKLASADVPNVRDQRRAERGCVIREERRHRPAHVAEQSEIWRAMISMAYVVIRPAVGEYDPQMRGTNQADSQSISPPILYICPSLRLLFLFTSQQGMGLVDRAKSHVPVSTETSHGQLPPLSSDD
jgi:hypothetical protein